MSPRHLHLEGPVLFTRASSIHTTACRPYWEGVHRHPGIAYPFNTPPDMPRHRWRVSRDVMQALTNASPPPVGIPNPKTADGFTKLLFGWPVDVDRDAPDGTLLLEPVDL